MYPGPPFQIFKYATEHWLVKYTCSRLKRLSWKTSEELNLENGR